MNNQRKIEINTSPHIHDTPSVETIMRNVVYALLPVCAYAVYLFGISALALLLVVTGSCLLTELLFDRLLHRSGSIRDFSTIITGLLLALTLPPGFPLWMGAVAGFIAIALGKALFGGLGCNVFNPALIGRAFVQAAFPVAITTWTPALAKGRFLEFIPSSLAWPLLRPVETASWSLQRAVDGFTGATPLALQKFQHISSSNSELFLGLTAGSAGETSALLILVCGGWLALRKMMDWRISAGVFIGALLVSAPLHYGLDPRLYPSPGFVLLSGGMMLGALFMATDMVGSPLTPRGVWLYGLLIGSLTVVIRQFSALNEGIMYAILIANAAAPLIAAATQPKIYGARKPPGRPAP